MKKRIGNDITFSWHIYRKDGETQVPESFTGKDVEVKLISPLQRTVTIEDVSIATGVVTFTFRGKHQTTLGNYVAVLQENRGENGMVTIDIVDAVTLVPHSYMEEDGDEGDVIEATSVELESTISAGGDGGFVQQQADWAQTDDTAVDFIKNKPDLDVYCRKDADNTHSDSVDIYVKRVYHEQGALIQLDRLTVGGDSIRFYHSHRGEEIKELLLQLDDVEKIKRTATSELDGLMSAEDVQKLTDIEAVIPEQASPSNKLVDEDSMNSSIATATATFRGAFNLVTDLHLSVSATHAEIATALATAIQTADNNDYCYVQIPVADATPTEFASVERYKFNGNAWEYEYTLNNSGFTAAQWAAINSYITSGLVTKLSDLPTATELATVATSGSYNDLSDKPTIPTVPTNVSAFNNDAGYITDDDVDDVPTANSDNPVKSGGVYGTTPSITDTATESDLEVSDERGNVLLRLGNGHIKTKNFDSSNILFDNIFRNKRLSFIGDSITTFADYPGSNNPFYTGQNAGITNVNQTWWGGICQRCGAIINRIYAYGGGDVVGRLCLQYDKLFSEGSTGISPNYIFILGGINDWHHGRDLGTLEDNEASDTTFYAAYKYLIKNLKITYPNATIICLSMLNSMIFDNDNPPTNNNQISLRKFCEAVIQCAKYYSVPYLDLNCLVNININNYTQILADKTHPNYIGAELITNTIIRNVKC